MLLNNGKCDTRGVHRENREQALLGLRLCVADREIRFGESVTTYVGAQNRVSLYQYWLF